MYDEVFKDLLGKFGSPENQKAVQQVDNVEKTVGLIEEIKTKYNDALFDKLYEPFKLYKEARDLITAGKLTTIEAIDANPRLVEITKAFGWNEFTPGTLYNLIVLYKIKSPDEYKSKVDILKAYFTNIKPSTTEEGTRQLEYLKKYNNPLGVLIRALDIGYLDSEEKFPIEDVKFQEGGTFAKSLEQKFFKGVYGSNLSPTF